MNEELILYYLNLLIIQYKGKEKAEAHISELVELAMIYDLIQDCKNAFDVDTAIGAQQDVLSKYIGTERVVTGSLFLRDYFGFILYGATPPVLGIGNYAKYGEPLEDVQYRSYIESDQSELTLNDEELRTFQKLKIIQNNTNHSITEIDNLMTEIFGDQVIFTDRFNMTISYIFNTSAQRLVTIAQTEGLIPKPMAVGVSLSFIADITQIFSYGLYGGSPPVFAVGYSQYGITPVGGFLTYG